MVKKLVQVALLIALVMLPQKISAESIADSSANLVSGKVIFAESEYAELHIKREAIREVLIKHNSPLVEEVDAFISACTKYNIDCFLLPSISGLESSYGKKFLKGSHNPFGWGGGYILFNSWSDCFHAVARGLRNNYYNRGADTINKIAPIYAESKTWAERVSSIRTQFQKKEQELLNSSSLISLNLP
jgi:hypothetical protein